MIKKIIAFTFFYYLTSVISAQIVVSGTSDNDIICRMADMHDGRLYAVIERNPDWLSGDFYAAFSYDMGDTWEIPFPIVTDAGNQSTFSVILTDDDSLRLFYASDETGFYNIYSLSSNDGINWINKSKLELGWAADIDIYDPQAIIQTDGSLALIYVSSGNGVYIAHCSDSTGWDQQKNLVQSGGYRPGICQNINSKFLAVYHRNISGSYNIHAKTSDDLINWSAEIHLTSNGNSHDPFCYYSGNQFLVYYSKLYPVNYNVHRRTSVNGVNWNTEEQFTSDNAHNTQSAVFCDSSFLYLSYTHAIDYNTNNDIYLQKFSLSNDISKITNPEINLYYRPPYLVVSDEKSDRIKSIGVYNLLGEKNKTICNDIPADEITVSLKELRDGVYIVRVLMKNGEMVNKKFVKPE
ncbi:MAG: hypothetical protein ABIJ97_17895 [Bacteroidota bacterium]